ncbi:PREDICTED: synaptic vesicle glycoprotein 2B-like [Ceratosolen solmsi marchali]|uniref:Synaptic vesicle glycoprotein 2B-like n=1 Tax=Ceratosolen solmsi marchali TaxID=326594 RepID=A0AAJ6YBC7_9HYME|nr:PREDICTED: synaptic vesicle glycoprotein 2B-like [Ceratosolen solmsi marchali]
MSADSRENGSIWIIDEHLKPPNPIADYDKAIATTGYGLFNILLLFAALPIGWTCIIDTTSTAFIINSTECVFELTTFRKGIAMSSIYIGMIISGPIWDFILKDSIIDYLGNKNIMIIGILLDTLCNILSAHATSFSIFILLKLISGILIAGPLSVVMAYLAEFHSPAYERKFTRWAGLLIVISNIIPPAVAAILLSRTCQFSFTIYQHFYPTWRVYLLMCAIPSVLGLLTACFMPNSPKFLLTHGKNREALRLFRIMFSMNNFKSSSEYEINELDFQQKIRRKINITCKVTLCESISNLKLLFSTNYVKTISVILLLQFSSMIGFNVMRLWVPSVFVVLNNFRVLLKSYYPTNEYITMCEMIFPRIKKINYASCNYTLPSVESAVYVNSTIIATSAVTFSFIFALLTDARIKKICITFIMFLLSAVGSFGANWVIHIPYMLVLLGFIIVACRITSNCIIAYNAQVMPQFLRITAFNVINFIGNCGAAAGNVIFSLVLGLDCVSAFLSIGCIAIVSNHRIQYYLSHDGVFKPDSITSKLRVIFNDINLTSTSSLHRHLFAIDITKIYRQIRIHNDDWDLQRILWMDEQKAEVPYHLTTVTYGTKAVPFFAVRTLLSTSRG